MRECKYNDFSVRFVSQNEEFDFRKKYSFALFENGDFKREMLFSRSDHQLIFNANKYMQQLGNCEKFIVVENGVELILLWTSLKGKPEKMNMRGGKKQLLDYLVLSFCKPKSKCLYIGNSVEGPTAFWRNGVSVDVIYTDERILEKYLKETQELYLPF